VPAFNAASTLAEAIRSALAQPEAREVLIIDDASTDGTAQLAAGLDDGSGRLRYHRLAQNSGPAAARNVGLALAASPWVAVLDADDLFLPGRLGKLLAHAADADLVADDLWRATPGARPETWGRLIGRSKAEAHWLGLVEFVGGNITRVGENRRELGFLKPLIRAEFLRQAGLRYDERLRLGEDFMLYARALAAGARFKMVEPCGYVAIERPDSLSARHGAPELERLLEASRDLLALPLKPAERAAVRRHAAHVHGKLQLRRVLDARRRHGLAAAALEVVAAPTAAAYVLTEGLRGALIARSQRRGLPRAARQTGADPQPSDDDVAPDGLLALPLTPYGAER
jgi:succinoglycan biosynthesis protein ExoU